MAEYDAPALDSLLEKVFQEGGYDFRNYKRGTIIRRLAKRLHCAGAGSYREYMHFLDIHPEEYQRLADDLTIKVSGFFRSQYSFRQLVSLVMPELISGKEARGERQLRFWSTACACGEEPYSIALLLAKFLEHRRQDFNTLIYATDISRWALDQAETGVYSLHDLEGLPHATQASFFTTSEEICRIRPDIRETVDFSRFDLTSTDNPPFTEIDCIFCCNVLIYWQKQLQERVMKMLYDALATPGYLVLGEVETPTNNIRERLVCLDRRA
ncbi:CheR family methyltransferase [Chloroflexota bacterium]